MHLTRFMRKPTGYTGLAWKEGRINTLQYENFTGIVIKKSNNKALLKAPR